MTDREQTRRDVEVLSPDAVLVQATADLLAARVGLYNQQPGNPLIKIVDRAIEALLSPVMVMRP